MKKVIYPSKFHLVDQSPWPLIVSYSILSVVLVFLMFLDEESGIGVKSILFFLVLMTVYLSYWFRDVIIEGTYLRKHTEATQKGLKIGVFLFILSEVMFFFSFFWAYFHVSLSPTIQIGCVWPPFGLQTFFPFGVPLVNTLILLLSGASITTVHYAFIKGNKVLSVKFFLITLFLALLFTLLQVYEYMNAPFSINTGIYGSVFFMLTGFHGFHVIIGTCFIVVQFIRYILNHYGAEQHIGLLGAIWYWHFVDVVWLFL